MPIDPDLMKIVQHLSRYLQSHPEACDTSAGIERWWLDADPPPLPAKIVEEALAWMAACGVVESSRAADGRTRFRRASDGGEVEARLAALAADPLSVIPLAGLTQRPPRLH